MASHGLKTVWASVLVLVGILLTLALMLFKTSTVKTTPLSQFTAPFVFGQFTVPASNPLTKESVELGRRLFYDPLLSGNNLVSCASCHQQSRAFTDNRGISVGISGVPLALNSMSLANLLWGPQRFFWDGRVESLEQQALEPLKHVDEMAQDLDELLSELENDEVYPTMFESAYGEISLIAVAAALANFQRTLISANAKYDQFLRGETALTELEEKGRKLFMAHPDTKASLRGGNCIDCHSQFLTSGFKEGFDGFSNNGLDTDENLLAGLFQTTGQAIHRGLIKVPTLRNIAVTAPYMHDGRFNTLEQVLQHYNSGIVNSATLSPLIREASNVAGGNDAANMHISLHLAEDEMAAIIAFLHTLTDESFLTNPMFSNPFEDARAND